MYTNKNILLDSSCCFAKGYALQGLKIVYRNYQYDLLPITYDLSLRFKDIKLIKI